MGAWQGEKGAEGHCSSAPLRSNQSPKSCHTLICTVTSFLRSTRAVFESQEVAGDVWLSWRWLVFWGTRAGRGLFSVNLVAEPGRANSHPRCSCPGAVQALFAF